MKLLKLMANAIGPSLSSSVSGDITFSSIGINEFLINFGTFAYWYTNIRSNYTVGTGIKVWPSGISFKPSNVKPHRKGSDSQRFVHSTDERSL